MAETGLKFDEVKVCTDMAKNYLKDRTEFHSIGVSVVENAYEYDKFKNKVYVSSMLGHIKGCEPRENIADSNAYPEKLYALAQKIEKNAELFCQLEFLYRNIPISDTRDVDVPLITQSLIFRSNYKDSDLLCPLYAETTLSEDTPLFHLGLWAYKPAKGRFTIVCTKWTVAVCSLFVELCIDTGLGDEVALLIVSADNKELYETNRWRGGCVGVVGARCDVDSAVDAFVDAGTRYPWSLKRILVHEAALQRFKRALAHKTRVANDERLKRSGGEARRARNHTFLLDFVGDDGLADELASQGAVVVEAFRSVKEALGLISSRKYFAVSAWSSNAAEANELAFSVNAALVWINSLAKFRGPPASAAAVYTNADRAKSLTCTLGADEERRLKGQAWRELKPETRLERIREVTSRFHEVTAQRIGRVGLTAGSVVTADNALCITTRETHDIAIVDATDLASIPPILDYLANGGALIIRNPKNSSDYDVQLLSELLVSRARAPVHITDSFYPTPMYYVRAIWTSIGTMFAN